MADARPKAARPLSPHLQIYKPSITMTMSIIHRITGVALYLGTFLLVLYLLAVASGGAEYAAAAWFFGSFIGKLILFGYTWALFHHALGGVRHLIWDTGAGMTDPLRDQIALATLIGSVALTLLTWVVVLTR